MKWESLVFNFHIRNGEVKPIHPNEAPTAEERHNSSNKNAVKAPPYLSFSSGQGSFSILAHSLLYACCLYFQL